MAYSLKADILKKVEASLLTTLSQGADANITQAILEADDEIDSYLRSVIDNDELPLAVVPPKIVQCSVMIAIKNMAPASQFQALPEWIKEAYAESVKYLQDVARGIANLNIADTVTTEPVIESETPTPIFTRSSW